MKKIIFVCLLLLGLNKFVFAASISVSQFVTGDDVTIAHLESLRSAFQGAINSSDGGLLQTGTVTTAKLDANANPENRWSETFNNFVYTGLTIPTSASLSSTTAAGTAYIKGVRVVKDATAHTYTASKHTYVDLSSNGTYTYSEVAINAAEPTTTSNSIRLAQVSTDATTVLSVRDDRVTTVSLGVNLTTTQSVIFDGATVDSNKTTLTVTDPTANRTQTLQNNTGIIPLGTAGNTLFFTTTGATALTLPTSGTLSTGISTKIGSFTKTLTDASVSTAYTGVGFRPSLIFFFASVSTGVGTASFGYSNATNDMCVFDQTAATAGQWDINTSQSINTLTASGSYQTGDVTSFDSDGFTISWVKTGTPTGTLTVTYCAIK